MEKILIRERINAVSYENENLGLLYTSQDIDVEGGIVNVTLESDVAGWYQLEFDIPGFILKEGKHIVNPMRDLIFPLSKLQYTRITRCGDEEEELVLYFIVQPEEDSRDDNGIVLHHYSCLDYPRHNLSKSKNGLTIGEGTLDEELSLQKDNKLIDVPGSYIYRPAPVQQSTFSSQAALVKWGEAKPGAFAKVGSKYYRLVDTDPSTMNNWHELGANETYSIVGGVVTPAPVWNPEWGDYPDVSSILSNVNNDVWSTANEGVTWDKYHFYWDTVWFDPEKTMGRYDGRLYKVGSRLLYDLFESTDYEYPDDYIGVWFSHNNLNAQRNSNKSGTIAYCMDTKTIYKYNGTNWENTGQTRADVFRGNDIWKGEFEKLDPVKPYLTPNTADAYLTYILRGTDWKVGTVDEIYIDDNTVSLDEEGRPKDKILLTATLDVDNSNAYNAIAEVAESFKVYPRFDHVNKTVSLKSIPGDDNGLVYQWRDNLKNSRITQDGEKAVSKLWVYGGEDNTGQVYIEDCIRSNPTYYKNDYTSVEDYKDRNPESTRKIGDYFKVTEKVLFKTIFGTNKNSTNIGKIATLKALQGLRPEKASDKTLYFVTDQNSYWFWKNNMWYDSFVEEWPTNEINTKQLSIETRYDNTIDGIEMKGQFYHWYENMSPFADNYIFNFDYFLDRGMMTNEQVKDIQDGFVLPISRLRKKYWPLYSKYIKLNGDLIQWNATYDECKIARDAVDKSMRTSYAIYDLSGGKNKLKELEVNAYPPGANFGTGGWVKASVPYATANAVAEYSTWSSVPSTLKPRYGDVIKIATDSDGTANQVYIYEGVFNFDNTIPAFLGWKENQIHDTEEDAAKKEGEGSFLYSPSGTIEARRRTIGLFEKLRETVLANDPERDEIKYWYNPTANINDLPRGPVGDPINAEAYTAYYEARERYVTEDNNMMSALEMIANIETEIAIVEQRMKNLMTQIESYETALRIKYGDFIVEGAFTDDTMVWKYNLWYAGIKALNLYHRPLVTYELGVVDVSGLPEYRTPTKDIYHDIVYRLNKPELVLPNAGDYCYVTDNTLGIVNERANVTSVVRHLSNPSENEITIATVDTNTEDLIGKLVTAANTIYDKQHIYNRSAIINPDGTIATDNLGSSLDNPGAYSLASSNGSVVFGSNGITTIDANDASYRMRYTGKGIYASTDGGYLWQNILTAGRIDISSLSAGSIDANRIQVTSYGSNSSVIIDGKGITGLNYKGSSSNPDFSGISKQTTFFLDSQTGDAFFRGHIESGSGKIGGWTLQPGRLYSGSGSSYTAVASDGTYAFWAGAENAANANFWVKHNGEFHSKVTSDMDDRLTTEISVERGRISTEISDRRKADQELDSQIIQTAAGITSSVREVNYELTYYSDAAKTKVTTFDGTIALTGDGTPANNGYNTTEYKTKYKGKYYLDTKADRLYYCDGSSWAAQNIWVKRKVETLNSRITQTARAIVHGVDGYYMEYYSNSAMTEKTNFNGAVALAGSGTPANNGYNTSENLEIYEGLYYMNTSDGRLYYCNGTTWTAQNIWAKNTGLNASSKITQTSDAITLEVKRAKGEEDGLSSRIKQTANSIEFSVSQNGDKKATFQLDYTREGGSKIIGEAQTIEFKGLVSFTDLEGTGTTTINGANIKTGTISAERLDVDNIKVKAANITGTLTASQINASSLSVNYAASAGKATNANYASSAGSAAYAVTITGGLKADQIDAGVLTAGGLKLTVTSEGEERITYHTYAGGQEKSLEVGFYGNTSKSYALIQKGTWIFTHDVYKDKIFRGLNEDFIVKGADGVKCTMHFVNGLYTGITYEK